MEILFRKKTAISLLIMLVMNNSVYGEEQQRWSRQLDNKSPAVDSNDWVPLSEPCTTCKQGVALENGILSPKSGRAVRFAQHDSAPAAQSHFNFVSDSFNNRFNFQHTHPSPVHHQPVQSQPIHSQPVHHQPHAAASDINTFPQGPPVNNLQSVPPFQFLPSSVANNAPKQAPLFLDQGRNDANRPIMQHLVQQKPQFQFIQQQQPIPQFAPHQSHRLPPFQSQTPVRMVQNFPPHPQQAVQQQPQQQQPQDEVQLLYVPYNTLYNNQQGPPQNNGPRFHDNRFDILNQPISASAINDFYAPNTIPDIPTTRRPSTRRITTTSRTVSTTSPKPTTPFFFSQSQTASESSKPKAHQPPLSMFLLNDQLNQVSEKDVLSTLRNSNSIDVRDTVSDKSPKIFIGPAGMSAPKGYTKFELPYLSSLESSRSERRIEQMPFFVAPLSYRTPPGFSKIPLPAPHVGSVVVNQPENSIEDSEPNVITSDYYTKQPIGSSIRIERPKEDTGNNEVHRFTLSSGVGYKAPQSGFVEDIPLRHSTPSSDYPTRESYTAQKVSYTPKSEESFSTALPTTTRPPKTEFYPSTTRHQPSTTRQPKITRPSTARPQIAFNDFEEDKPSNEDFYGHNNKKVVSSFKFGTIYDKPSHDFNFKPMPDLTFPSDSFEPSTYTEEPVTKKSKQKESFKYSTTEAPKSQFLEETFSASPKYSFPSSTASPPFEYSPTPSGNSETSYQPQFVSNFDFQNTFDSFKNRFNFNDDFKPEPQTEVVPDIVYSHPQQHISEHAVEKEPEITTTEKSDYSLPSDLPPINAQIPGLVNSLIEERPEPEPETTTETVTRRPVSRGRRPVSSTYRTTTEYPEVTTSRRTINRGRRPTQYNTRSPVYNSEASSTTERQVTRSRTNIVRNPNRVRYNGTNEERNQIRSRTRLSGSAKLAAKEENNLDYQRDVLNQNYPSIRPQSTTTNRVTEEDSNEKFQTVNYNEEQYEFKSANIPSAENVEVIPLSGNVTFYEEQYDYERYNNPSQSPLYYHDSELTTTVTPSTSTPEPPTESNNQFSHNFLGLQEPMLIPQAQHKTQKHKERTYENFYNQNSQTDEYYTSPIPKLTNDDDYSYNTATTPLPSRSTTSASTNEQPVTRRGSFPRRRPTSYTTPEPITTTPEAGQTSDAFTSRNKSRKENVVVVKKVRQRVRKPVTTTEETVEIGNQPKTRVETSRRVVNSPLRSRPAYVGRTRETTTTERPEETTRARFRIRENTGRFKLEQQESQWSTRLTQNSFQPYDEDKSNVEKNEFSVDDEQEIVTAGSVVENDPMDTYLFNVSASVAPAKKAEESNQFDSNDTTVNMISTTESEIVLGKKHKDDEYEEPTFVKLMKDALTEIVGNDDVKPKAEQYQAKLDKKPTSDKKPGRRGVWKKVRVRPADGFETAESQNIGNHFYNSLNDNTDEKKETKTKDFSFEFQESEEQEKKNEKVEADPTVESSTEIAESVSTASPSEPTTVSTTVKDQDVLAIEDIFGKVDDLSTEIPESDETDIPKTEKKSELIEVAKKALTDLFHFASEENDDETDDTADQNEEFENEFSTSTTTFAPEILTTTLVPEVEKKTEESVVKEEPNVNDKKPAVIVGTSTSSEISHETEICYRGRCIKTDKNKNKKI